MKRIGPHIEVNALGAFHVELRVHIRDECLSVQMQSSDVMHLVAALANEQREGLERTGIQGDRIPFALVEIPALADELSAEYRQIERASYETMLSRMPPQHRELLGKRRRGDTQG